MHFQSSLSMSTLITALGLITSVAQAATLNEIPAYDISPSPIQRLIRRETPVAAWGSALPTQTVPGEYPILPANAANSVDSGSSASSSSDSLTSSGTGTGTTASTAAQSSGAAVGNVLFSGVGIGGGLGGMLLTVGVVVGVAL